MILGDVARALVMPPWLRHSSLRAALPAPGFYGHPAVWAGSAILCAAWPAIVRWEERQLLERFGDDYRAYLAQVPPLGTAHRAALAARRGDSSCPVRLCRT